MRTAAVGARLMDTMRRGSSIPRHPLIGCAWPSTAATFTSTTTITVATTVTTTVATTVATAAHARGRRNENRVYGSLDRYIAVHTIQIRVIKCHRD